MKTFLLTCLLFLVACSSPPRVSTDDERAIANATLTTVESVLTALAISGKLTPDDHTLATQQLGELRKLVDASATTPVQWLDIYTRVLNFGVAWTTRSVAQ